MAQIMQILGGGSLLHRVSRSMTTKLDRRFATFGLTTQQAALLLIACGGVASPGQLAAAVGTDTAGMTKLLDRLQDKGLLRRRPNPADRRSVLVEPTERGQALVPDLTPVFGEVAGQAFDGFSGEDIADLTRLLRRMSQNLE